MTRIARPTTPSCASVRAARRWRWCRRARCRAASPRPAASTPRGSRSRSSAPPATSIQDGRWPTPAARACSPRRSRRRCWPAPSTSPCIPRRTCRPCCRPGSCCRRFCRARTRATPSSAARPRRLRELPHGAVVGTASLRRQALVKRLRPDLAVVPLRGNVETRLRKIEAGDADATLLARRRLEAARPACGGDRDARHRRISAGGRPGRDRHRDPRRRCRDPRAGRRHRRSRHRDRASTAERAFLAVLDGSCRTPIAGHARVDDGIVRFRGMIVKPDGSEALEVLREGRRADAAALGADAGRELKAPRRRRFFRAGLSGAASAHAPEADAERTAAALRARGHEVDHRAAAAHRDCARCRSRRRAVGGNSGDQRQRGARDRRPSARATNCAAFRSSPSASAARRPCARPASPTSLPPTAMSTDLARLVAARMTAGRALLYLAGEERSGDLAGALRAQNFVVQTALVYRAVAAATLAAGTPPTHLPAGIDGVLHFSRRSAEAYVNAARGRGLARSRADEPAHYCLSAQRRRAADARRRRRRSASRRGRTRPH